MTTFGGKGKIFLKEGAISGKRCMALPVNQD